MSLLQKRTTSSEHTRARTWAMSAIRLLSGGGIFAVVKVGNILVPPLSSLPTMNTNLSSELTGAAFGLAVLSGSREEQRASLSLLTSVLCCASKTRRLP